MTSNSTWLTRPKTINAVDHGLHILLVKLNDADGAKEYIADTDFLSDSPIYYYGNAALEYNNDNGAEAEKWLARARRVFGNPRILAPWQDTLIEFGYVKSFYGGDLELESGPPTGE